MPHYVFNPARQAPRSYVRGCGWTADQYEQWVGDTLVAQLLR